MKKINQVVEYKTQRIEIFKYITCKDIKHKLGDVELNKI